MSDMPFADFLDLAGVALDDGSLVSAKTIRLVEIIRDYDPALDVEWIPQQHRLPGDDAIRVIDTRARGLGRTVMSFPDEGAFTAQDGRPVLERLFLADTSRGDPLARLEAANAAAKALELKRAMERKQEGLDLMRHALASPLHTYTYRNAAGEKRKVS